MICPEKKANFLSSAVGALNHSAGRALPVFGAGLSAYDVTKDLGKGDFYGAGIDTLNAGINLAFPFAGMPANILLDMYNSRRKEKRDEMEALKNEADRQQQLTNMYGPVEKSAASNFEKDLHDPRAGVSSDLYQAISPLIASQNPEGLSSEELAEQRAMQEQVRKGLVGLEYMTGLKKNTGNTYYDEHPAAALGANILGNAIPIGAAVGAGGAGLNLYDQYRNLKMTRPGKDARTGNYGVDPSHPRNLLNPKEGPIRADIARVFGDFATDPSTRLELIDQLNAQSGRTTDFAAKYEQAVAQGADPKKLFNEANKTPGAAMLENYANLHESAQKAKAQGGFKKYFGEDFHTAPGAGTAQEGAFNKFVREKLAPSHMQGLVDLAETENFTGANPNFHREILKRIGEEYSPGAGAKAFAETGLRDLESLSHQGSGLGKLWKRTRLPLAAGAGLALGGAGLYTLVKALQNQGHSKEKINEWKKTLLQSRGDFDRAAMYDFPHTFRQPARVPETLSEAASDSFEQPEAPTISPEPSQENPRQNAPEIDWSAALNSVR